MGDATCTAEIHHGPGHQSVTQCERRGPHTVHAIFERYADDTKFWVDEQAKHQRYDSGREGFYVFTGFFNESPLEADEDPGLPKPTCPTCHKDAVERLPDNRFQCRACGAFNEAKPIYEREENPTPMKLYARYLTPGVLMSEESTKEVESVEDALAKAPASAFCFRTYRLPEVDFEYDHDKFTVKPIPQEESGCYYIGGEVWGIEEVRANIDSLDATGALLSNMEGNGWDQVIKCRTGNWQPFFIDTDSVIEP